MATPMYAGFMRPTSYKYDLIISFEEAGIQIKEPFYKLNKQHPDLGSGLRQLDAVYPSEAL
jgi:hypothetical protein